MKMPVRTETIIRVKFPDEYVIQGTFGANEQIQTVYKFVKENLVNSEREFYLYKTPPKKPLTDMKLNLQKAGLVPSGLIFFGWSDLDQTRDTDGPFLDIANLKDKIVAF